MRKLLLILFLVACGVMGRVQGAETYKLVNGETLTGEALTTSANDAGIQIKIGDGEYQRVPWANFSQDDLKKFAQNAKLEPLVEPFIEITQEERIAKTEVVIKQPPRLEKPAKQSIFAALASSGIGFFLLVVLYAANLYAAYEIAIFRAQSVPLVCGVSAVLPLIGPIIFLSMRTKVTTMEDQAAAATEAAQAEAGAPAAPGTGEPGPESVNPMLDASVAHPSGLKLHSEPEPSKPAHPPTTTYQRGQFTFNRRFLETKFVGFFGTVRRDAEKGMVLVFKTTRGEYTAHRITRIAANDLHVEVHKGQATEEIMIPFQEIQEIRHKHESA